MQCSLLIENYLDDEAKCKSWHHHAVLSADSIIELP